MVRPELHFQLVCVMNMHGAMNKCTSIIIQTFREYVSAHVCTLQWLDVTCNFSKYVMNTHMSWIAIHSLMYRNVLNVHVIFKCQLLVHFAHGGVFIWFVLFLHLLLCLPSLHLTIILAYHSVILCSFIHLLSWVPLLCLYCLLFLNPKISCI